MYFANYFNSWMWVILLFICVLVFVVLVFCERKKVLSNSKRFVDRNVSASESTCTSLSCVRCSNSVFSNEKLLNKWSVIAPKLGADAKLCQRITNAIARDNISHKLSNKQAPTVFYLEEVPAKMWYTAQDYAREVTLIESKKCDIISEFCAISQKMDIGWVSNPVPSGGWFLFHLVNQGIQIEENCQHCPKTMMLIKQLPLVMSDCVFGNVMFSILLPGTKIAEHCGPTNVRIRCHVPISIPEGYFIQVGGQERTWQEDQILIFDDSFYHEVYHYGNSDEPRVVLMIDFWHLQLSYQEKEIIKSLFSLD